MISLTANEGRTLLTLFIIRVMVLAEGCRNPVLEDCSPAGSYRKTALAKASGSPGETSASIYFGPGNDITGDFSAQQLQSRKTRRRPPQRQFLSLPGSNTNNFRTNMLDEEKTQNAECSPFLFFSLHISLLTVWKGERSVYTGGSHL